MYNPEFLKTTKAALKLLTGYKKRQFVAQIATEYFGSSPRKVETYLGAKRSMVALALEEYRTGIARTGNFSARGRKKKSVDTPI